MISRGLAGILEWIGERWHSKCDHGRRNQSEQVAWVIWKHEVPFLYVNRPARLFKFDVVINWNCWVLFVISHRKSYSSMIIYSSFLVCAKSMQISCGRVLGRCCCVMKTFGNLSISRVTIRTNARTGFDSTIPVVIEYRCFSWQGPIWNYPDFMDSDGTEFFCRCFMSGLSLIVC